MKPLNRTDSRILFIDMNSFFASCEQAENPALVGKPTIVVPTEGSCALSASYEAKAFGIYTGTPEREARFLCPNVQVVQAKPKKYMEYHYRIVAILESLTPRITIRSVDEASVELCRNEEPFQLAREIKERIWQDINPAVHCSIGIAPNVFLAKLATELEKPNGLVEITMDRLEEVYKTVELRELCGINYGMERQLHGLGIYSVLEFYNTPSLRLQQALGVIGERWWLRLHGYEVDEMPTQRKTLSHSHVLPPQYRAIGPAFVTAQRLVTKIGRRLRKNGFAASKVSLYVRFTDKTNGYGYLNIRPTANTLDLKRHIERLWNEIDPQVPVLKISIWTAGLVPLTGLPSPLFPDEQKQDHLSRAIDRINDKFGIDVVRFAVQDTSGSRAPDRISFNALFDIEHE